jgi:hypothetical protein
VKNREEVRILSEGRVFDLECTFLPKSDLADGLPRVLKFFLWGIKLAESELVRSFGILASAEIVVFACSTARGQSL